MTILAFLAGRHGKIKVSELMNDADDDFFGGDDDKAEDDNDEEHAPQKEPGTIRSEPSTPKFAVSDPYAYKKAAPTVVGSDIAAYMQLIEEALKDPKAVIPFPAFEQLVLIGDPEQVNNRVLGSQLKFSRLLQMKPRFNNISTMTDHLMHDLGLDMSLLVRFFRNVVPGAPMMAVLDECHRGPPAIFEPVFHTW